MSTFNETTKAEQANNYQLPPIELLNDYVPEDSAVTEEELTTKKDAIVKVLNDNNMLFGKIIATVGPTVTLFEIAPEKVDILKLYKLDKDFAANLNVEGVRIVAPIWERGTIGIEVPNAQPQKVSLRSLIASEQFQKSDAKLPIAIGQTVDNATYVVDFTKKNRLLIVGDDDKEKSTALNTILVSLLYNSISSQVKFVMIDAQDKNLMPYQSLPECFYAKRSDCDDRIITDNKKINNTLESLYIECLQRFTMIEKAGCHDIDSYNNKYANGQLNSAEGFWPIPYIVVVINNADELIKNDITKKIKHNIDKLANAPVYGVLYMITTKYTRLSSFLCNVMSVRFHSREKIISKQGDLEDVCRLNGNGDALVWLLKIEEMNESRVQCAEIDNKEIERIVNFVANQSCNESAYILPNVNLTTNSINESNVLL
ncbi:MAG: DNA translocase FtsK [Salinivirgaceae bacterium]|nr:DNA translocase FtsK [Salinivirgaceae bacterium]